MFLTWIPTRFLARNRHLPTIQPAQILVLHYGAKGSFALNPTLIHIYHIYQIQNIKVRLDFTD